MIAGGVESMSRAPFVMPKAETAFSRKAEIYDTTIGWRFVNPLMKPRYGIDSMPETGENVAAEFGISRADQDAFAARSQARAAAAIERGRLAAEIAPVTIPQRKGEPLLVERDEHPRPDTTLEQLARLPTPFREGGTITAGNASGVNDGAAALIVASEAAAARHGLTPIARVVAGATVGVPPRIMGIGPAPATRKLLRPARMADRDDRRDRAERSVREPGVGDPAPAGHPGRRRTRQSEWRRDRARPSARHVGRQDRRNRGARVEGAWRAAGRGGDVHRRRPGDRGGA